MLVVNNINGRNIAEFYLHFLFEDFFSELNNIKNITNLTLVKTEENEVMVNGHLAASYSVFYIDQSEQIEIRISDRSFAIDFNNFITYNDVINENEFIKMRDRDVQEIRIILTATSSGEVYFGLIGGIRKYQIMEDISRQSKHQLKKNVDSKRPLKYIEIRI